MVARKSSSDALILARYSNTLRVSRPWQANLEKEKEQEKEKENEKEKEEDDRMENKDIASKFMGKESSSLQILLSLVTFSQFLVRNRKQP